MTITDELIAVLGYKIEGEGELKRFNSNLDQTEGKARSFSDRVGSLAKAAGAAGIAAGAVGVAAVRNFAGFEREMNRIGVTAGATVEQTASAGEELQRLATKFALPIEEAVSGLDTLTASGMSLDEAMAFLPSVLATAQAAGASTRDIANTAQKASSALKIEAGDLQRAFDIMVSGGKAGQFELKDMAAYIPELANSFASLGYDGQEGLQRLIATLQTIREDTGSASSAATQAQNVFGKIFSEQTAKQFKDFGIDLRTEMEAAKAAGEDALTAFVRISRNAIDGDLSKLPQLFTDQEFRLGMQSLITSQESFDKFLAAVNGAEVDGTVFNDLNRIIGDTQAGIDNMSTAWDNLMKSLGQTIAPTATGAMNSLTNELSYQDAVSKTLESRGYGFWQRQLWMGSKEEKDALAREGGYVPNDDPVAQEAAKSAPFAYKVLGRRPQRPISETPTPEALASREPRREGLVDPNRVLTPEEQQMPSVSPTAQEMDVFAGIRARFDRLAEPEKDAMVAIETVPEKIAPVEVPVITPEVKIDSPAVAASLPAPAVDPGLGERIGRVEQQVGDVRAAVDAVPQQTAAEIDPRVDVGSEPTGAPYAAIAEKIEGMNATLAKMTGASPAEAVITDARQDNRNQSVTVQVGGVTVQGAQNAGPAVGAAVGNAVGNAAAGAARPARVEGSPQF